VHAARLAPDSPRHTGQTAVILEPAKAADLSPLILDLHGLTSRERQITQPLLRGLATADVAKTLFISRHTLSDHMKAIFDKLEVSSRPELTALLLDRVLATT
jgi:DNA-binding NarL/FixJ family response regulator